MIRVKDQMISKQAETDRLRSLSRKKEMEECTFKPNLTANHKAYFARTASEERSRSNTRSLKEFLRDQTLFA